MRDAEPLKAWLVIGLQPRGAAEARPPSFRPADLDIPPCRRSPEIGISRARAAPRERRRRPTAIPAGLITGYDPEALSALEVTRSAVWPLVLALGVGIAIGFAGGFFAGSREQPAPAARRHRRRRRREFTEGAVLPRRRRRRRRRPANSELRSQKSKRNQRPQTKNLKSEISNLKSPAPDGRLLVRSRPAGARVSVDGKDYGRHAGGGSRSRARRASREDHARRLRARWSAASSSPRRGRRSR